MSALDLFLPQSLPSKLRLLTPSRVGVGLAAAFVALSGLPSFLALALGACIALAPRTPILETQAANKVGNKLMKASIIALGAGMNLSLVFEAGATGLATTALTLAVAVSIGILAGRALGIDRDIATLVTVGTAICGGSAIAAMAPVIQARARDVGVALGVVFVLNAVALFLFPILGAWLEMDPASFGRWSAFAIHDTSSVVGAAAAFGPQALEIATVTKLARALWIIPVVLIASQVVARREGTERQTPAVPKFILGFVGVSLLVTLLPQLRPLGDAVSGLGRTGLLLALFSIGLGFSRDTFRSIGPKALVLGIALWIPLGLVSLLTVTWLN